MEQLQLFFTNSWVISFLTGLVVYSITKIWENFRTKKNYIRAVELANKEVFNTLKLCVPEDTLPNIYSLRALHLATSKRYGVKQKDLDSLSLIIFDLIKEIMDSSFLSYNDKIQYCRKLESLESSINEIKTETENDIDSNPFEKQIYNIIKNKQSTLLTNSSALILGLASVIISFGIEKASFSKITDSINSFEIILLIISFGSLLVALISFKKN
ncbi:hypothetical protein F7731_08545 [Cytobacillus depressus]|uniref:Uncharacterized protein n=1 Tax=Cytobacillus depressus TaxID=1602942 RepID=A0A6L3V887_9BACI|nr:hypothetical protein [Cytobacillus depressus]KAB2337634.1 hypothetical protein F7731_08545 [Cytobacillus depressus]